MPEILARPRGVDGRQCEGGLDAHRLRSKLDPAGKHSHAHGIPRRFHAEVYNTITWGRYT